MVRRTAAALTLIGAGFLSTPDAACAQSLARLTVQSFTLSADSIRPRVDEPFRLIVALRVKERVTQINNLELPMLADLELLGDERQTVSVSSGTQYRETITVVARSPGTLTIAPATLQAIDARDGKPKQWSSNGLTLSVSGVSAPVLRGEGSALLRFAREALWLLLWLVGLGILAIVVVALLRRREHVVIIPPPPRPMPPPMPPPIVRTRRDQLQDALTVLRAERTRAAALAVRDAVWRMLGASGGATLGDVLRRRESGDPTMRDLLVALERAAFTYDEDLQAAIEDGCGALERSIGSLA